MSTQPVILGQCLSEPQFPSCKMRMRTFSLQMRIENNRFSVTELTLPTRLQG